MKKVFLLVLLGLAVSCVPQSRPLMVYKATVQQLQDAIVAKGLQTQPSFSYNFYSPVVITENSLILEATPLPAFGILAPNAKIRLAWTFVKRENATVAAVDAICTPAKSGCSDYTQVFTNDLNIKFVLNAY